MEELPKLSETPPEIINLILDLVIDIKLKKLDFDVLISLLKQWHNKILIRELILELISNIEVIDLSQVTECEKFIIDLIKINETGLAKIFYDLLMYSLDYPSFHIIPLTTKTYEEVYYLKEAINFYLIEECLKYGDIIFERLFKIINQFQLYLYISDEEYNPADRNILDSYIIKILKAAIKLDTNKTFIILFCGYRNNTNVKNHEAKKYLDIVEESFRGISELVKQEIFDIFTEDYR